MGDRALGGNTGGLREEIRGLLEEAGFAAVGFAEAGPVDRRVMERYDRWLSTGQHAGMEYMERHREVREDPRRLLEGARTIISTAYCYRTRTARSAELPTISRYAFLPDYHELLKKLIRRSGVEKVLGEEGKDWRICVDTAPIFERYWAERAGVGVLCANGMLAVPGVGSEVFLAEIICRLEIAGTAPEDRAGGYGCNVCGVCRDVCPGGALGAEGMIDCRRCLSYLTIEHHGDWSGEGLEAMQSEAGRQTLFGCDRCITGCPLNRSEVSTGIGALGGVVGLTAEEILEGDEDKISARIQGSCLKRAKYEGLARNAHNCNRD